METLKRKKETLLAILEADLVSIVRHESIPKSDEEGKEELKEKEKV